MRKFLFTILKSLINLFKGSGLGKIRLLRVTHDYLVALTIPRGPIDVHNYKMYVYQKRYGAGDIIVESLILNKTWEPYTTEVFSRIIQPGMSIIDIGANIGYFTLLAAGIVGVTGNVYAFEPEPQNYSLLARNVRLNGFTNVRLYQKAVSRSSGKMNLNLGSQSGTHSLFNVKETTSQTIMIDLIGLDEIFVGPNNLIDVIKVDVQGAEIDVLMGMQNIIKGSDNLQLFTEFEPDLAHAGFSLKEYWNRLIESGFKYIYLINEQERKLELSDFQYSADFCTQKQVASVNLLCSRNPENI